MGQGKIDTRWFQGRFKDHNLTQRKVATQLDRDPGALSLILRGKRRMTTGDAASFARILGEPLELILHKAGISVQGATSRDSMKIGGWVDKELRVHWGAPKGSGTAPLPAVGGKGIEVVRLQTLGGPMEGMSGGLVYFKTVKSFSPDVMGKLCVVKTGKEFRFGVVARGYSPGFYNLTALSGVVIAEDIEVESASPVIWLRL